MLVFALLSGAEIGRFVAMLRNSSSVLKACAAFALLQVFLRVGFFIGCVVPQFTFSRALKTYSWRYLRVLSFPFAVYYPWWQACNASRESNAECRSSKSSAGCCSSSNCSARSQNLCPNCTSQSRASSHRILTLRTSYY